MRAFNALSSCRASGWSDGPIPWTAAKEYAVFYGIGPDDLSRMWDLLSRMDKAYINHRAEAEKLKNLSGGKGGSADESTAPALTGQRR